MLAQFFKIIVVTNSTLTVTYNNNGRFNLKLTGWIVDPTTGKITYTQLADDDLGFTTGGTLVDGAEIEGSEVDNSTTAKYLGMQAQLEVIHDEGTGADGTFDLYLSTGDATGELQSDATGYDSAEINLLRFIGPLTWHDAGADDEIMRSDTFEI